MARGIEIRDAHFPGRAPIDAYGNGGFRFADMSHRGSILCLPSGIHGWKMEEGDALTVRAFERVLAEAARNRGAARRHRRGDPAVAGGTERGPQVPLGDLRSDEHGSGRAHLQRDARRVAGGRGRADRGLGRDQPMAAGDDDFAHCLNLLREMDRDRYLACLLVPEAHRGAFAAIYAFNAEVARVRDVVRNPLPGEVRLQWWRDLADGRPHGSAEANPVAAALSATIERYGLPRGTFDSYIEARTFDLYDDPMPDRTTFEGYAGETVSAIMQLCAMVLSPGRGARGRRCLRPCRRGACRRRRHASDADPQGARAGLCSRRHPRGDRAGSGELSRPEASRRQWRVRSEAFGDLGSEHLAKARSALDGLPPAVFPAYLPAALAAPVLERARKAAGRRCGKGRTDGAMAPAMVALARRTQRPVLRDENDGPVAAARQEGLQDPAPVDTLRRKQSLPQNRS